MASASAAHRPAVIRIRRQLWYAFAGDAKGGTSWITITSFPGAISQALHSPRVGLVAGGGMVRAAEPALTARGPLAPFYPIMRPGDDDFDMTRIKGNAERTLGRVIEVTGRVLGRQGNRVSGAELELWQCNAAGR